MKLYILEIVRTLNYFNIDQKLLINLNKYFWITATILCVDILG